MKMLDGMPPRRWGEGDFPEWLLEFLDKNYPSWRTSRLDLDHVVADVKANVPRGCVPRSDALVDGWVVNGVNRVLKHEDHRYVGNGTGREIVAQLELPLDEFRRDVIDDLRRASADIASTVRRIKRYAEEYPDRIPNVTAFVTECRKVAGL